MSNPKEADTCVPETQETYYESMAGESFKIAGEAQNASFNESQDFRLIDSGGDESMAERKQTQDEHANSQKSIGQTDVQRISEASRTEDNDTTTANDKENKPVTDEKTKEDEAIEKTEGSEKKDELFDEDEVIQGTPPQSCSPSRKMGSINVASLKRKIRPVEEPPTKVPRMTSAEDTMDVEKRLEEREESHQSFESDDSYQDLFKNIGKKVTIEETQDPTNLEFTQDSLNVPAEHATETAADDKSRHHAEQINQQQDETSEKCDMEKNDNVSMRLIDTSANDSTVANLNSTNENDPQLEGNNLSVETGNVASTSVVIADEKSGIGTSDEIEFAKDKATASENNQVEQSNGIETAAKTVSNDEEIPSLQIKSRNSIELIFEGANRAVGDGDGRLKPQIVQIDDDDVKILDSSTEMMYDKRPKSKPEVVEIDDSHEKIVLGSLGRSKIKIMDKSSYESKSSTDFSYKESMKESSLDSKLTDQKLVNGSTKRIDNDVTLSLDSDTFSYDEPMPDAVITAANIKKVDGVKGNSFASKSVDNIELISISDNETSNVEEKNKSDLIYNSALAKTVQVEREIGVYLKLKCLIHVDENTKEPVSKELTGIQCEPLIESMMSRQKNEDSQSSLADISDNKDSPSSVHSNLQLYPLNPSRFSIVSSVSSSSSASSAVSLLSRIAPRPNPHCFSKPLVPPRNAKKFSQDGLPIMADKMLDEAYDRLTREWKNYRLLTTTVLNYVNTELSGTAISAAATAIDNFANVSNERLYDHHHLEKNNMRSSTPSDNVATSSKMEATITPKSTKKGKAVKKPRSKLTRSNDENGANDIPNKSAITETDAPSSRKKSKIEDAEELPINDKDILANSSPRSLLANELIGKKVFAKWSDNNYYPGTVSDQLKTKYKVNFYDGKTKTLLPEFVIPIPKTLREGLSVYATTETNGYSSCGIIVSVQTPGNDDTYYTVETDEDKQLDVQLQNISLSYDQAQVLKEEMDSADKSSLPSTPKAFGQVTLDNLVDGKRRSKRIGTPVFSTPKSRGNATGTSTPTSKTKSEPSGSGMSAKLKKKSVLESEDMSSDSNVESIQDEYALMGVQEEINSMPYGHIMKGPQSKIKGKSRSKRREDPEVVATLGPIPIDSNIFKDMSFILTCISLNNLNRYLDMKTPAASSTETEATETDLETENEDEWVDQPFVRDRLHAQIVAGGGKIYENFQQIPKDEYENTLLITNVPNITATSILCLSAGIRMCNHKWIIRCCAEGKLVNVAEHALPNGWSLQEKTYIEAFQTSGSKPLSKVVVIIPSLANIKQFVTFWQQVCENAGAVVLIAEDSAAMESMDFDSNVVVVSNKSCPSWAINRAIRLKIPVLSTTWVTQCLIEGKICPYDQHPRYRYNYISN